MFSMTYYTKIQTYPAIFKNKQNMQVFWLNMSVYCVNINITQISYSVSKAGYVCNLAGYVIEKSKGMQYTFMQQILRR